MRFGRQATGPILGLALLCVTEIAAQERFVAAGEPLESRIWLDRGANAVLRRGDQVRVFYRASRDAYVSIFHIDTNGFARLLHPGSPTDDHFAAGGRDYRVLYPESRYWRVDEDEGKGYLFVVASAGPLDLSGFAYSRYGGGWDLAAMTKAGYRDPFLMMDDVIATLVPEWRSGEYALDFVAYDIDRPHDYPRFLCYGCHGFMPMFDWNPYDRWCTDFRVVIHDDPYYYPVYRYRGDRVVYTRPLTPARPMFAFQERASGEAATPLIRTRPENGVLTAGSGGGGDVPLGEGGPPTARVPGLRAPARPAAGAQVRVAPPEGPALPGRVVRQGVRVPSAPVQPPEDMGARVPVEGSAGAGGAVAVGGAGLVVPPDALGDGTRGASPAAPLPAASPGPDAPPADAAERDARPGPDAVVPAGARAAESRDERPVLQRRGGPPSAGSGPPPPARPRTPPGDRPPPSAGRPPSGPPGSAAGSDPGRPPATRTPPAVRPGPPPRSSGPPPVPSRTRPPGRPPVA